MGVLEEEHRSQGMAGLDLTVWEAQDNSMAGGRDSYQHLRYLVAVT
jgi:hypothetical protein